MKTKEEIEQKLNSYKMDRDYKIAYNKIGVHELEKLSVWIDALSWVLE